LKWGKPSQISRDQTEDELKPPRVQKAPYRPLTEAEIARMADAATTTRDKALLAIMLGGGLHVSDVVHLDARDILQSEQGYELDIRDAKGGKRRQVPIGPEVASHLLDRLDAEGPEIGDDAPLFCRTDRAGSGGRLTARAVRQKVGRTAKRAGEGVSPSSRSRRASCGLPFLGERLWDANPPPQSPGCSIWRRAAASGPRQTSRARPLAFVVREGSSCRRRQSWNAPKGIAPGITA
jgi:integrase